MQPAVALDVSQAGRFGGDEAILQPELFAQADAFGLLHEQRIGTRVDREAVDLFAEHDAAGAAARLEQGKRDAAALELERRREARDAAADDDDLGHVLSRRS